MSKDVTLSSDYNLLITSTLYLARGDLSKKKKNLVKAMAYEKNTWTMSSMSALSRKNISVKLIVNCWKQCLIKLKVAWWNDICFCFTILTCLMEHVYCLITKHNLFNEISLCENLLEFWVIRTQFWSY